MKVDNESLVSLLSALQAEEANLVEAASRVKKAHLDYDLASSRFAAIRDLVKHRLGTSPYSTKARFGSTGLLAPQYRFLNMNPGDAAIEVLYEASYPLPLEQIVEKLEQGGLKAPGLSRSVNAALMNRAGIVKDGEGGYHYDPQVLVDSSWDTEA